MNEEKDIIHSLCNFLFSRHTNIQQVRHDTRLRILFVTSNRPLLCTCMCMCSRYHVNAILSNINIISSTLQPVNSWRFLHNTYTLRIYEYLVFLFLSFDQRFMTLGSIRLFKIIRHTSLYILFSYHQFLYRFLTLVLYTLLLSPPSTLLQRR